MKKYSLGPETKRLFHREFMVDDTEAVFSLNSNPEVMRYTGEPLLQSLDAARQSILDYPDFNEVGFGRWACVLKENNAVIGFSGLKYLKDLDCVDVGYRLLPEYWGHGYATESCIACLKFGFKEMGLKEIVGLALPENTASIRVLEKSGMQFDSEFMYDGEEVIRYSKKNNSY